MKFANDTLVVALTSPLGGGVIIESKNFGYLSSEGLTQVRKAIINSNKVCVALKNLPCRYEVELKDRSIAEGLLEISEKFSKSIVCRIHRVPYIPQSAELIKMGFIGDECYERAQKLHKKIEFHEWVPDYIRQLFFSSEVCGTLLVMDQKNAAEHLPHCVKVIGYLEDYMENKPLII